MASRRKQQVSTPRSSRSSLTSHTFPPFYSCYLLKSIQHSKSRLTYIGSTPHPPRRIRQHNGLLTAGGAWKTSRNRPWAMTMIVYGFPSKLAALQFEWAWQHPTRSRHLREAGITGARSLKGNIQVVYSMLTTNPYTSWPLHVKLFTPEAVKAWNSVTNSGSPIPLGMTVDIELEGVDGNSGEVGSGRIGPIEVTDKSFTAQHLTKHMETLSKGRDPFCTVCGSPVNLSTGDPLTTALCPNTDCTAYSHLLCLANSFLNVSEGPIQSMIPRGGTCSSCNQYILWGDIIRGCYRRRTGFNGALTAQEAMIEEDEDEHGDLFSDTESSPGKQQSKKKSSKKSSPRKLKISISEEGEFFDLDNISGSESSPVSKKRPSSLKKNDATYTKKKAPPPAEEGEFIDFNNISSSDSKSSTTPRKRKTTPKTSPPSSSFIPPTKETSLKDVPRIPARIKQTDPSNFKATTSDSDSANSMASSLSRRRGRPKGSKNKPKLVAQVNTLNISEIPSDGVLSAMNSHMHTFSPKTDHLQKIDQDVIYMDGFNKDNSSPSQENRVGTRPRGRPKGSKNKPKQTAAVVSDYSTAPTNVSSKGSRSGSPAFDIADILKNVKLHESPNVRKKTPLGSGKRPYSTLGYYRTTMELEADSIIEISD